MRVRGKVKPSRQSSVFQMIGGGVFVLIGLIVVIPAASKGGGPVWFGVLWTFFAAVIAVMGAINAFSSEGIPTEEFSWHSDGDLPAGGPIRGGPPRSVESRLRELNALRDKGLVTEDEYTRKRDELLRGL
jgi:hypothetical protein